MSKKDHHAQLQSRAVGGTFVTKKDRHAQLPWLFVCAVNRYVRRRNQWSLLHAAGAHELTEQRAYTLTREAAALVERLGAQYPMSDVVEALPPVGD